MCDSIDMKLQIMQTQPAPHQDVICVINKIIELYVTNTSMIRSVTEFSDEHK